MKLKQELGIAYDTVWTMSHKIRHAMGDRDSLYMLSGTVEVDDAFFGGAHEGSKRGRGTDKTAVVLGPSLSKTGRPKYMCAKVVEHVDGKSLVKFAKEKLRLVRPYGAMDIPHTTNWRRTDIGWTRKTMIPRMLLNG